MTRSVDIEFNFDHPAPASKIPRSLPGNSFSSTHNGSVSYFLGDDEMYDWKQAGSSQIEKIISLETENTPE